MQAPGSPGPFADGVGGYSDVVPDCDVLVVGGGPAGLTAAVTLSRARRSVTVVDDGRPRNAAAHGVRGFLSRDGIDPHELLAEGRREVTGYGGTVIAARVLAVARSADRFDVALDNETRWLARHVIVATGLVDSLPAVAGVEERWGRDVLHCPYCHGWENADRRLGILATSRKAAEEALLVRQWSPHILLLQHTWPSFDPSQIEALAARGIDVVAGEVTRLIVADDRLCGVGLADGSVVEVDALFVAPRLQARAGLLSELGVTPEAHSVGNSLAADSSGRTSVPGLWAVGNVVDLAAQAVVAAAEGMRCAVALNWELVEQDVADAGRRRRPGA
jgi:thioredoxin reductase